MEINAEAKNTDPKNILLLLQLDAKNVYQRVVEWFPTYMAVFAAQRTRQHFGEVFFHRYHSIGIDDLKIFSEEVIIALDQFYQTIDEMGRYLKTTEDMPVSAQDQCQKYIAKLKTIYPMLELYLNAEKAKF